MDATRLRARIAALRGEYVDRLAALCESPTVSMDRARGPDIARCAALGADYLRGIGAAVDCIETAGNPILVGRVLRDPAWPTVTVYNHLDVQPADPAEWKTHPFRLTRDGDRFIARGSTDDKGPALAALYGAHLALEAGVRCNIQFLWELEEEIGSPHFEAGLRAAIAGDAASGRAPLSTDSVVVSDTIWIAAGRPAIPYGLRGLLGFTVRLETGAKDVHSGTTGGAARNPVGEIAQLLAECHDARSGRVKIPGFHRGVRRLSAAERAGLRRSGFDTRRFRAAHELRSLRSTDPLRLQEAIMAQPTFEVHGIAGGYTGPGIKTIVPHAAEAKCSTRLVPDQDPARVLALVKAFVKKRLPDATVTHEATLEPYIGEIGGPYNGAAAAAMRETFGRDPAFTREGGSIGAVLTMRKLLGAPIVFLGLSLPEHGYHAVNENFDWGQAAGGMEMFARYFENIASLGKRPPAVARSAAGKRPTRRRRVAQSATRC